MSHGELKCPHKQDRVRACATVLEQSPKIPIYYQKSNYSICSHLKGWPRGVRRAEFDNKMQKFTVQNVRGKGSGLRQHWGPALQSLPNHRMCELIIRPLKT